MIKDKCFSLTFPNDKDPLYDPLKDPWSEEYYMASLKQEDTRRFGVTERPIFPNKGED